MIADDRNKAGLTPYEISRCIAAWELLGGNEVCCLDVSTAHQHLSRTRYSEDTRHVILGADVKPGVGADGHSALSELACLAHELGHASRHAKGYQRPFVLPDKLLDEAEANIDASFNPVLGRHDREALVGYAGLLLDRWLLSERRDDTLMDDPGGHDAG